MLFTKISPLRPVYYLAGQHFTVITFYKDLYNYIPIISHYPVVEETTKLLGKG